MPFIDKSPLNYRVNSTDSIRRYQDDKAPTSSNFKEFKLGDEWHDTSSDDWYKLCAKTLTSGTWRKMAGTSAASETFTGNSGGAVPPDGVNNINLLGAGDLTVTGNPGTNTLTISDSSPQEVETLTGNSGGAVPPDGADNINIVGSGNLTVTGNPGTNTLTLSDTSAADVETLTGDVGGAVSPDGAGNINVLGGTGFTVTGNPGTNTLTVDNDPEQNIIYLGKHGNDANDGFTIERAKLTFGAAITAASAIAPATVVCFDTGQYTETISVPANVSIDAPNAILNGAVTVTDDTSVKLKVINVATGTTGLNKATGTGCAIAEVDGITCVGTGNGMTSFSGCLNVKCRRIEVENGFGAGIGTTDQLNVEVENILISGTGSGFGSAVGGTVRGEVQRIENTGAGAGTGIFTTAGGGDFEIYANQMNVTTGIAATAAGSTVNYIGNILTATTAYNIPAGSTLNLTINELSGVETVAAGATVNIYQNDSGVKTNQPWTFENPETTTTHLAIASAGPITFNNAFTFPTTDGSTGQVLKTNGAGTVTWGSSSGTGEVVQHVSTSSAAYVTCNTGIPTDDTIPQQTEGNQIVTVTITPTDATHRLIIRAFGSTKKQFASTSNGAAALFQDATANALSSAIIGQGGGESFVVTYEMVAGTTSPTTFKLRVGPPLAGGFLYVNGSSTNRLYGGTAFTTIEVWEIGV